LDLSRGAIPTSVHGLAAVYLGFSVGFGHYIISRADAWFAHQFADVLRPSRPPRTGPAKVRHEWQDWLRVLTAWAIAVPALLIMKAFSGWSLPSSMEEFWTDELWSWVARLTLINIAWLLTGPVYTTIFRSRYVPEEPETRTKETHDHSKQQRRDRPLVLRCRPLRDHPPRRHHRNRHLLHPQRRLSSSPRGGPLSTT